MAIGARRQAVHGLTNDRVLVVVGNPKQRFVANVAADGPNAVRVVATGRAVVGVALQIPNHHIGTNRSKKLGIQPRASGGGRGR